jgi:DNA-directed RNA polymerase I subunit RPA1
VGAQGERTIRMHYANCNTFNADFDGDEMNLHLPQELTARSEGYNIVNADYQYIVPTSGTPVRGLIQVSSSSQTMKGKRSKESPHLLISVAIFTANM